MNTPVEHVVDVTPGHVFYVEGDGEGHVKVTLVGDPDCASAYMNRSEVNALIGALQNAVTFEWEG